jgi:hypothetical protein
MDTTLGDTAAAMLASDDRSITGAAAAGRFPVAVVAGSSSIAVATTPPSSPEPIARTRAAAPVAMTLPNRLDRGAGCAHTGGWPGASGGRGPP